MLKCVCGEGTWGGGGQEDGGDMRDRVWGGVCMGEGVSLRVYMGVGWGWGGDRVWGTAGVGGGVICV